MIMPYGSLEAKGLVFGLPHVRRVTGFADPAFRFSMNFIGAPALTAAEFKNYRQDLIVGASLRVTVPVGQYDEDKLVNIGTNRFSLKPEIGCSKAFGPWTVELVPAVTLYTDNDDFFGGKTREVAPLYSVQTGLSYTFIPGAGWLLAPVITEVDAAQSMMSNSMIGTKVCVLARHSRCRLIVITP